MLWGRDANVGWPQQDRGKVYEPDAVARAYPQGDDERTCRLVWKEACVAKPAEMQIQCCGAREEMQVSAGAVEEMQA